MRSVVRTMSILVLLAGIGHIYLALGYDHSAMQMLGGGIAYLVLGILVCFSKKSAMILSSTVMLMATIGSRSMFSNLVYPVIILRGFLVINVLVIIMTIVYLILNRRLRKETI